MKITAIRRHRSSPDRVNVHLDNGGRFTVDAEQAKARGFRVGGDVDEAQIGAMARAEEPGRARDLALRMLAAGPKSTYQMRTRLRARGFTSEVVEGCLADLTRSRLLDDEEYARAFVRSRIRNRPRGPRLLIAEMGARGVDAATAGQAVEAVCEEEGLTELDLARMAATKLRRRRGDDPRRSEQRVRGFLARKGFSQSVSRELIRELRAGMDPR